MSKIFSYVEMEDAFFCESFWHCGWMLDEDDFLSSDCGSEFYDQARDSIEVNVTIYSFGYGESESADLGEVIAITQNEELFAQCDVLETRRFVVNVEDSEYDEEDDEDDED